MSRRWVRCAGVMAGALLFSLPCAVGATNALLIQGTLHTISVESRGLQLPGTRLLDMVRASDGSIHGITIPGTEGAELESDPALVVPPTTGQPVLVWVKGTGQSSEILVSAYSGTNWSPARALTANTWEDGKPQPVAGPSGNVNVMWRSFLPGRTDPSFFLTVLDSKGGTVLAPYEVYLAAGENMPGTGMPASVLVNRPVLFAFDGSSRGSGDARIVAYGGTDEPIPTLYRIDFRPLDPTRIPQRVRIERIANIPLLLLTYDDSVVWSVGMSTGWTPYAMIGFDAASEDKAELLIRDMLVAMPK